MLPLFARRTQEVGQLLPELYLHGLSQGDFELALRGLLGEGAPLSKSSIAGRPRARLRLGGRHRAPRGAREPGGMQGPTNGLSQQPVEAGGSLTLGAQGKVEAASTTTEWSGTSRHSTSGKQDGMV